MEKIPDTCLDRHQCDKVDKAIEILERSPRTLREVFDDFCEMSKLGF